MNTNDSKRQTFHTTLLGNGKTAVGIEIPPDVVTALGAGKRPAVKVTIHEFTYRSTVAVMGGKFMVGVSAENRAGAGVGAGDDVEVELEVDTEPRVVTVPEDFAQALARQQLTQAFDGLAFTHRKEHVRSIEDAKSPETRQRRIDKALSMVREGRR